MEQKESLQLRMADSFTAIALVLIREKIKYEERGSAPITEERTLNRDYFKTLYEIYENKR